MRATSSYHTTLSYINMRDLYYRLLQHMPVYSVRHFWLPFSPCLGIHECNEARTAVHKSIIIGETEINGCKNPLHHSLYVLLFRYSFMGVVRGAIPPPNKMECAHSPFSGRQNITKTILSYIIKTYIACMYLLLYILSSRKFFNIVPKLLCINFWTRKWKIDTGLTNIF